MRPWVILAALAIARAAFGYQFQTIATLAPDLVPRFGLTYTEIGSLIGVYNVLGVFTALPFGLLGRRFGDRPVLAAGLALMAIGGALNLVAASPSDIALGRGIAGVGAVAMIVLHGKVIADWFHGRRFMIGISVSVCAYPIGIGLTQIVLPPVARLWGWQAALATSGVAPALALLLFLAGYRRPPRPAADPGRITIPAGRELLLVAIGAMIWTAYTAGYSGYTSYLPATLAARGASLGVIGLALVIATWGNVPATLWGGDLAARFGGRCVFLIGAAAGILGMIGTALTGEPVAWAFLVGVIGSIHPGVIMAVGTLSARPENRAIGMGLFYSLYYLGGTVSPAICGAVADAMGTPAGGILAAAALAAVTVPMYLLHRALARHEPMPARA